MKAFLKKLQTNASNFFIPQEGNHFRPKSLEQGSFFAYILIALVLKLGLMSFFSTVPTTLFFAEVTRSTLVALTNDARVAEGLPALQENSVLQQAAELKAHDLLERGYFAHESPDGKTPWYWFLLAGYRYLYAGENLAIDFVESADVVKAWLESPGHRANIVNGNYRDIGIAVASGKFGSDPNASERVVVVQLFGNSVPITSSAPKPSATPIPTPTPAPIISTQAVAGTSQPSPIASAGAAQPSPAPSAGGSAPSVTLKPTILPTATPLPTVEATPTPAPSAVPTPTPAAATVSPAPTLALAGIDPGNGNGGVLGSEQPPIGIAPPATQSARIYAGAMSLAEFVAENVFFIFLAFVVVSSLLNIFIRRDVQHPDLLARAFVLMIFFLLLVALRSQTFLHLTPQVL
ncbi:MAG: CAP domain-containing protein [bacterium]|nr:CAP domain-containing protein [bacterium]